MSNVVWLDNKKEPDTIPFNPNPIVSRCPKCGLELQQTMYYCCMDPSCPTGLGGTRISY